MAGQVKPAPSIAQSAPPKAASMEDAIAAWNKTKLSDYGKNIGTSTHEDGSLMDVISEETGSSWDDEGQFKEQFSFMQGQEAIKSLASSLREVGAQIVADGDDEKEDKAQQSAMNAVADQLAELFKGFKNVTLAEHMVSEDGDVEYRILAGQKKDGSWAVVNYSDFPF